MSTRSGPAPTSPPTSSLSPTSCSHKLADEDGALADLADELSDGLPGALRQHRALERLLDSASAPAGELVDRALAVALAALDGGGR